MRTYGIGEVAEMLGVKPHVIRYWEQEIPFLAPRKGITGRREYASREVRLLLRLKHLVHENRYTIEGARQRLWEEIETVPPGVQTLIAEIRDDLVEAWSRLRGRRAGASGGTDELPMI
jgi:DNA-binding transcriptional MerR regulator